MSLTVELNVTGLPATQGSHFAIVRNNHAQILPVNRAKLEAWRGAVSGEAKRWMAAKGFTESPWDRNTPLAVTIIFRLPEPKTRPKQTLHERRPDLDKLIRSSCDGLRPLVPDDARISVLIAVKKWCATDPPGAEIFVREALEDDIEEIYACWAS